MDHNDDPATSDAQAQMIFVLGLLGLVACQICGPFAWSMGNKYMEACAANGLEPNGMAVAGRIMGLISSILLIVTLVMLLLVFAFYAFIFCCYFGMIFLALIGAAAGA